MSLPARSSLRTGEGETLVDGDGVGDAAAHVEYQARGAPGAEEGEDGLLGDVKGGDAEALEHDLGGFLLVGWAVHACLGGQGGVVLGRHAKLAGVRVMPYLVMCHDKIHTVSNSVERGQVWDLLHFFPVVHATTLDGVLQN